MNQTRLGTISYDVIRREVSNIQRTTSNAELGNFVRGVVELEREIYMEMEREISNNNEDNRCKS